MGKRYCVIGYPIGHSMSPFIHKELFAVSGYNADYERVELPPEQLAEKLDSLKSFNGFNVTLPYKTEIIRVLDGVEDLAKEYDAVNTVNVQNGKMFGDNTDAYGFLKGLKFCGIPLEGKVLVYGFGGAAKTIIAESVKAGCEVTVCTTKERKERAENTSRELSLKFGKNIEVITDEEIESSYDLFVNASPVGMCPNVYASPLKAEKTELFKYVYDLVYNPEETELIKNARSKNIICGSGLSMLVFQAAKAQEIWYDAKFTDEQISKIITLTAEKQKEVFGR